MILFGKGIRLIGVCLIKFFKGGEHNRLHSKSTDRKRGGLEMNREQLISEIQETNLTYLLLAQQMIRLDRATATFRLGVSDDVAQILDQLSPGQILKMAASNMLLCRFRFDDQMILGLLTDHGKGKPLAQSHAAVLMAGQPALGLT